MEGNGNLRAWGGYYDSHSSLKPLDTHNRMKGVNYMSSMSEDQKPIIRGSEAALISTLNGGFLRKYGIPTPQYQPVELNLRDAIRDSKMYNMLPSGNHSYVVPTDTPLIHNQNRMHMLRQLDTSNEERMVQDEPSSVDINSGPLKRRSAGKSEKPPKTKKLKKASSGPKDKGSGSAQRAKSAKKTIEVVINGIDMDISCIPIPICSCTGAPQQCYRWGFGGWQSACCTTGMSMYPLPMSTKRRGARIAGRKMSLGAFKKVLEKLAAEGYNFSNPIDLRTHWAKHGTNKFVTIR